MRVVLLLLFILPAAAALICLLAPLAVARALSVSAGVVCLGLVASVVPAVAHRDLAYLGFLRADALSMVFLLATSFLYAAVAVY